MLSSCLPVIFGGAAASTLAVAKDRQIGETIDDVKIATAIKASLMKNDFKKLYAKVHIEVIQGRVLLTGTVENEEDIMRVVQTAWEKNGVKEVISELQTDKNSNSFNLYQYMKDSLITSQIKSRTFGTHEIKWVNYTVLTLNNVVYLFGIARTEEELEKVTNIAAKIKGVEKVISHVKVKEDNSPN